MLMKLNLLKGTVLLAVTMFNQQELIAQMYVSPNSYVFVKNEQLFVKGDLELNSATSNMYLRDEAQLLQGTTASGVNKGVGNLSVYQEGTADGFDYNYWCSPVGNVLSATAVNNPFGVAQLKDITGLTTANDPVLTAALNGTASPLTISNRWIYKFITSNTYANWVYVGNANTINAGEGFTMKGTDGTSANNPGANQRYDFRGKPNDGTISINVAPAMRTLTGNPYPSAINLNLFLRDPANLAVMNGTAYFWEHNDAVDSHFLAAYQGGYGTYIANNGDFSPGTYTAATWNTYNNDGTLNTAGVSTGSTYKRMFTPIGQGFKIEGTAVGSAQMKNAYRVFVKEGVLNNSQFERIGNEVNGDTWGDIQNVAGVDYTQYSNKELPQIKIHTVLNNQYSREVALAFNGQATDGFDLGMDAKAPEYNLPNDAYFPLDATNQFVISTLPFDINKRIPFAFKAASQTTFKVTVGNTINFTDAENVYLFDKQTGVYHDIKNNFFEITLPVGVVNDRFEITFKDAALSTDENVLGESLTVYQNNSTNSLTISNPQMMDLKSCTLYDVAGKLIFTKNNLGANSEYTFPTSNLSDGIYIVRVNTNTNQEMGKKVIVKH
ncbi:Por secretion system C-terminal sorting domain-containing protein [Flavobacterium saliperosum]|uniref:Por secretion system C-terminal sorting domain-containing protein n=3 Tax=Flavobacterium saliperosum TaxID=329186 RepID=A0A1G4V4Q0_9FLAO|nr:Por secretion system C-terminal sorting domain-containing protein [Flavobacterium saliperosum]